MLSKILTTLLLVGGASALSAGPVYSCGGGAACNGNLYAVWVVSQTATSYVLNVGIQVTDSYTGSKTDFIDGLAIIPDNNSSFTSATLTGKPAGVWSLQNGLGAGSCNGNVAPFTCAQASGMGSNLFTYVAPNTYDAKTLVWQFTIQGTPPSLADTAKIKYHYINNLGVNVGSTGSFNIPIQCIGGAGCDPNAFAGAGAAVAPEPMTSALIGSGLIGLYFLRRRRVPRT